MGKIKEKGASAEKMRNTAEYRSFFISKGPALSVKIRRRQEPSWQKKGGPKGPPWKKVMLLKRLGYLRG
jgi:hypothetical protein